MQMMVVDFRKEPLGMMTDVDDNDTADEDGKVRSTHRIHRIENH